MNYSWYSNTKSIKSPDAIHQILVYGALSDIKSLRKTIGQRKLKTVFLKYPKKIYTPALLNFVKKVVLEINSSIDEKKYLKNTPRSTG